MIGRSSETENTANPAAGKQAGANTNQAPVIRRKALGGLEINANSTAVQVEVSPTDEDDFDVEQVYPPPPLSSQSSRIKSSDCGFHSQSLLRQSGTLLAAIPYISIYLEAMHSKSDPAEEEVKAMHTVETTRRRKESLSSEISQDEEEEEEDHGTETTPPKLGGTWGDTAEKLEDAETEGGDIGAELLLALIDPKEKLNA